MLVASAWGLSFLFAIPSAVLFHEADITRAGGIENKL